MIFDGRELANEIKKGLEVSGKLVGKSLVIFQTGEKESVYVRLKREMGEGLGVKVEVRVINEIKLLKKEVIEVGNEPKVDGVMVQLPLVGTTERERDEILRLIPVEKDVDGLNPNGEVFLSAAVVAVEKILEKFEISSLKMAVVGSKGMTGKGLLSRFRGDLGLMVKGFDAGDRLGSLKAFDVVISATGRPDLVTSNMVKDGVIAIDLGFPRPDFEKKVSKKAKFFTPVPGGVGPVTVVSLFDNLSKTG